MSISWAIIFLLIGSSVYGKEIQLDFPHFAGHQYDWVMMNIRSGKGDQAFQDRLNNAIARMDQDDIVAAFAEKALPLLVEKGKDDLLPKQSCLEAAYTILLFYQGECPLCEDALIDLANKYKRLAEKNVRVIGISADKTEQGFQKKLAYHQWQDNYCDFTGMSGVNFSNYAVLGVPTLFLLDQAGVVLKKTAMVDELVKIVDKKNPVDPG